MKKFILGAVLFAIGSLCSAMIIFSAVMSPTNPWEYNGITGWLGSLLGLKLQIPLAIFVVLAIVGLILCVTETVSDIFKKK